MPSERVTFAVEFVFFSESCSFLDEAQESPLTLWMLDSIDICIHLEIRTLSYFFQTLKSESAFPSSLSWFSPPHRPLGVLAGESQGAPRPARGTQSLQHVLAGLTLRTNVFEFLLAGAY